MVNEILPIIGEVSAKLDAGIVTEKDLFEAIETIEPVTAHFEEEYLNRFYEKAVLAVREVDPESLSFLETNYFSNAAVASHIQGVRYNGELLKNQVYAPHGYDIFVDTDKYEDTDTSRVDLIFEAHRQMAEKLGMPMLVGEWGCYPNTGDNQVTLALHLKELFKNIGASDTYFDFSHLRGNRVEKALKN